MASCAMCGFHFLPQLSPPIALAEAHVQHSYPVESFVVCATLALSDNVILRWIFSHASGGGSAPARVVRLASTLARDTTCGWGARFRWLSHIPF
jgi:hypothetical protein